MLGVIRSYGTSAGRTSGRSPDFAAAVQSLSLNGDRPQKVVIDLTGLTFIDSSGIRSLLDSKRRAEEHGVALVVRVPGDGQVRQVLELTGMDHVFTTATP